MKTILFFLTMLFAFSACDDLDSDEFYIADEEALEGVAFVDAGIPLLIDLGDGLNGASYQITRPPVRGSLETWRERIFLYRPNEDFTSGQDDFTYRLITTDQVQNRLMTLYAADGEEGQWRPRSDRFSIAPGQRLRQDVLANDRLPTAYFSQLRIPPSVGRVGFNEGLLTFETEADFAGTVELAYELCQPEEACKLALVEIEVGEACPSESTYPIVEEPALPFDPSTYQITQASITGDCLRLEVQYSGGCGTFEVELWQVKGNSENETTPELEVQLHFLENDPCEALLTEELNFDLRPLRVGQRGTLEIQLNTWQEPLLYRY